MGTQQHIEWLLGELPQWIRSEFLSEEQAQKIRTHYQTQPTSNRLLTVFGVIGAVLVGVGIILLLAYNWTDLSRGVRTAISLGLLICAQALVAYMLWQKSDSQAWSEGSSIFLVLSLAASIALIGQTYHIPGNIASFLLTCCLLTLPLIYLAQATLPAILYLAGITVWYTLVLEQGAHPPDFGFWALFLGAMPWLILCLKHARYQSGTLFLSELSVLACLFALGLTWVDSYLGAYWLELYAALFAICLMGGQLIFAQANNVWQRAVPNLGGFGLLVLGFALSSDWFWADLLRERARHSSFPSIIEFPYLMDHIWLLLVPLGWLALLGYMAYRKDYFVLVWGAAPALLGLCRMSAAPHDVLLPLILINMWLLALGVLTIVAGFQQGKQTDVNGGMLIVALLIFIRFIDSEMGLIARGCAFIIVGLAFLLANLWMARHLKKAQAHG